MLPTWWSKHAGFLEYVIYPAKFIYLQGNIPCKVFIKSAVMCKIWGIFQNGVLQNGVLCKGFLCIIQDFYVLYSFLVCKENN